MDKPEQDRKRAGFQNRQAQPAGGRDRGRGGFKRASQAAGGTGDARGNSSAAKESAKAGSRRPTIRKPTARELALDVLTAVDTDKAYSNLKLNQALRQHELERAEAGLATELVYGTIQRLNTIDYYLNRFVAKGVGKLQPWVRNLLRLSFYQLYYLDRVPDHAAVNEAVNIAKKRGHQGISGMVNAVLRNVLRSKSELALPEGLSAVQRIALEHSHPEWMVARWIAGYGEETTRAICASNNEVPRVSVRNNALSQSRDSLLARLEAEGRSAALSALAPQGIVVTSGGNMALSDEYEQGMLSVQDESSMLVAEAVEPKPGMRVLDCCAAPGGKTAHMAEKMGDRGEIVACDLHPHKEQLIREQAHRLGINVIKTQIQDARRLGEAFAPGSFDRILLDAPCSGLGVIRRKPDLKWMKQEAEIGEIASLQYEILCSVERLLRPGGVLVYSTCTIEREENVELIERFLAEHPGYSLEADAAGLLTEDTLRRLQSGVPAEGMDKETAAGEGIALEGMTLEGKVMAGKTMEGTALKGAARQEPALPEARRELPDGMLQLLPQDALSDGFFIARLRKSS